MAIVTFKLHGKPEKLIEINQIITGYRSKGEEVGWL